MELILNLTLKLLKLMKIKLLKIRMKDKKWQGNKLRKIIEKAGIKINDDEEL